MKLLERIEKFLFGTEEDQQKLNEIELQYTLHKDEDVTMKNPFEIRTEILEMAKDYMDKQYEINLEMTKKMIEAGQKSMEDLPKMYTFEELEEMAKKMYSFVQTKD